MDEEKEVLSQNQNMLAKDPFFMLGGQQLYSLNDLTRALEKCDEKTFRHHVNDGKNDFAAWIRHSMGNHALANRIAKLNTKEEFINALKGKPEEKKAEKRENNTKPKPKKRKVSSAKTKREQKKGGNNMADGEQEELPDINKLITELEEETKSLNIKKDEQGSVAASAMAEPSETKEPEKKADAGLTTSSIGEIGGEQKSPEEPKKKEGLFKKIFGKKKEEKTGVTPPPPDFDDTDYAKPPDTLGLEDIPPPADMPPLPMPDEDIPAQTLPLKAEKEIEIPEVDDISKVAMPEEAKIPSLPETPPTDASTDDLSEQLIEKADDKKRKKSLIKRLFSKKEEEEKPAPFDTTLPDADDISEIPRPEDLLGEDIPTPEELGSPMAENAEGILKPDELTPLQEGPVKGLELPELPSLEEETISPEEPALVKEEEGLAVPEKKTEAVKKAPKPRAKKAVKPRRKAKAAKKPEVSKEDLRDLISIEKKKVEMDIQKQKDAEKQRVKQEILGKKIDVSVQLFELDQKLENIEELEKKLNEREEKLERDLSAHERSAEDLSNLKRKHDLDVRERTKYIKEAEEELKKNTMEMEKKLKDASTLQLELEYKEKFLEQREKDLAEKENSIKDKESEAKADGTKAKAKTRELNKRETDLDIREKSIVVKEKGLEEKTQTHTEKNEELSKKEETLNKIQKELDIKEKELNTADNALDMAMDKYSRDKDHLEDEEFHEYLHRKLSEISSHKGVMRKSDETLKTDMPKYHNEVEKLKSTINECRDEISNRNLDRAKSLYNQIRLDFHNTGDDIEDEEKESLHNTIRQLYDDINLGSLDQ